MRRATPGVVDGVILAVVAAVVACSAIAHEARAQTTRVETLPESDSTTPRTPFSMDAPNMHAATRLAGCYAITLGSWSSSNANDSIPVPSRVDLTSDPHTRIYIGFRLVARTPAFTHARQKSPPAWSPIGADSLQVRAWADGSSSLMFFLRRQEDGELRGTARYFAAERKEDDRGRWLWETSPNARVSFRSMPCGAISPASTTPNVQPRRSQRASVLQMLGATRVEITYSRPVARGRALFGALVPWGRVWNPGADTATALSIDALHPEGREVLRVRAVPERGAHMETLAYYFPRVDGLQGTLHLHWRETVVPLRLDASPASGDS